MAANKKTANNNPQFSLRSTTRAGNDTRDYIVSDKIMYSFYCIYCILLFSLKVVENKASIVGLSIYNIKTGEIILS